jgi:pyruvate,water dikinase
MGKILNEIKEPIVSELGGKGYSLVILINNRFNVPKGFVITSEAFFKFLKDNNLTARIKKLSSEINENNFQEKSKGIKNLILNGKMPEEIASEIGESLNKLNVQFVSIRSSAVSEDSLKASFAGLHDTFLNIKSELGLVSENIKKCWASLFNDRAVVYRIRKGIPHLEGMAAVIQEMIPAEVSGITFTVHPTKEKTLLIEASYGIGDMLVGGKVEPDDYHVDRETLEITEKNIGGKTKMSISRSGVIEVIGVKKVLIQKQVIPDEEVKEIAKICLKIEKLFKYPQDIEWCIYNNKIWILQSRAITGGIK